MDNYTLTKVLETFNLIHDASMLKSFNVDVRMINYKDCVKANDLQSFLSALQEAFSHLSDVVCEFKLKLNLAPMK